MDPRFLSTLGLCMRAGRLAFGLDTVRAAAREGRARLVLTAADLSPKTLKETEFLAQKAGLPHVPLPLTMAQMKNAMGKKTGVIAITDDGLARRLQALLADSPPAADPF